MSVRPLAEADIPQIAQLYWTFMRRRKDPIPQTVLSFLHELCFSNPFSVSAYPSLVYEAKDGRIVGFLGRLMRKMSVNSEPLMAAFGGNLVVHPEFRSGLAAPRLIETFLSGDYELILTDSANNISKRILERMDFRTVPALNIHWRRPLRPSHYAVYALSHGTGPLVSAGLRLLSKPFCSLADSMAARLSASPFRQNKSALHGAELDVATHLDCLAQFRTGYSLWAEYDANSLEWLLSFMARRPARGKLRKVVVRDDNQKIVGWYVYYVKPGAIGEVVQIGGDPKFTKDLLDHLFYDAWERGVIALHGVVDRRRMPDFSDKGCFFTCRGGWTMVKTSNPEVMDVFDRGDGFLTRLDGEWCLDPGD